ncbi:hypothetical protein AB0I28_32300 [Phytomonospora sp. NPDC050363]|uniref:hypothetical protein n=1 Tax=Phytomonospora sp. NPDC050363 TaxID=3155642 RepID=UPI0033C3B535
MSDVLVPDAALVPTTVGPTPITPVTAPRAVSYGYAQARRLPPQETLDFSHLRYDADRGLNIDTTTGAPGIFSPRLASNTQPSTTEDMQTWTDRDSD